MGNQQSQSTLGLDAPSALTPDVQRRLSKSPFIKSLLESASRPSSSPRNMPSLTSSWYEASSPLYAPPRRASIQTLSHDQLTSSHKSKHGVTNQPTTTTTTKRGPNGQYYVVSTTTYYVKSPTSKASNSSTTSGSQKSDEGRRNSLISSSDGSSFQSDIDLPRSQEDEDSPTYTNGFQFTTINGRRYISVPGTRLRLACDDDECDRLIILHFLLKYAFNGNFTAPVKEMLSAKQMKAIDQTRPKVLDIGCGSGTWLLEMATEYPNSDFYGVDICHMYPDAIKPANARFKQCNVLDGLPFQDNKFDYVHIRLMLSSLTERQAVSLLQEVARILKPGGMIEICDVEYRIQRPGPVGEILINQRLRDTYTELFDIKLDLAHHLSTLLMMVSQNSTNGFVDIHQRCTTIPLGWGGKFGEVHAQTLEAFLLSLDPRVREITKTTQQLSNWTPAGMESKATMLTDAAIKHIVSEGSKYQSHLNWFVCYGRKPFATFKNASEPPTPFLKSPLDATASSSLEPSAWESINNFASGYID